MRRICFFPGNLAMGGIGKVFVNLIDEYASRGIEVDLFLTKKEGEFLEQLPSSVRIFEGGGRGLNSILKFIKYLRAEKPQAVLSAKEYLNIINIVACLFTFNKTKPIVSLHTNQTAENNATDDAILYKKKYFLVLAKLLYKIPKKIIAVSDGVANDFALRMGIDRQRIQVIYNPIYDPKPIEHFEPNVVFEKFVANGKKFIIGVGRFTKAKDFPNLIRAFYIVRKKMDVSLVILGEGSLREELQTLIEELDLTDHVLLPGFVSNPSYYVAKADVFVVSSKFEGFGNVIVEALGVGTPVVSTDCPSGPGEILANGKYGKLVPVEDPEALATSIIHTLNCTINPNNLIDRAKDFSIPKIADEYSTYIMS